MVALQVGRGSKREEGATAKENGGIRKNRVRGTKTYIPNNNIIVNILF